MYNAELRRVRWGWNNFLCEKKGNSRIDIICKQWLLTANFSWISRARNLKPSIKNLVL